MMEHQRQRFVVAEPIRYTKIFVPITCIFVQVFKDTKDLILGQLLKRHSVLLVCGAHLH
jgi:hypothetical protein